MRLTYTTFLARDVAALCQFYVAGLGLEEVASSRDERYREVRAHGGMIGFATSAVRSALNLADDEPTGTRSVLTFDVGAVATVMPAVERAIAAGAEMIRGALDTPFGQHQAVLRDPEGNIFRVSAATGS